MDFKVGSEQHLILMLEAYNHIDAQDIKNRTALEAKIHTAFSEFSKTTQETPNTDKTTVLKRLARRLDNMKTQKDTENLIINNFKKFKNSITNNDSKSLEIL